MHCINDEFPIYMLVNQINIEAQINTFDSILANVNWGDGACSGTVYSGEDDLTQLMAKVRKKCLQWLSSVL